MTLPSTATVATVGLLSKAFLKFGTASVTVNGLQTLLRALESQERINRGIVTVSNHISTLDDPVTWGVLPPRCYFNSRLTRWTLGASDIMFTNPLFSTFFRLGQTIETFRGKGIYQPAVDTAIDMLNRGYWIHLYSEGKVCQPSTYAQDADGSATLSRFKWGIGRIIMEADIPPIVIPMWVTGFEKVMPEGRPFPYKYMPRFGTHISITFGEPLDTNDIQDSLRSVCKIKSRPQTGDPVFKSESETELDSVRSNITEIIRTAVLALGKKVSGPTLTKI